MKKVLGYALIAVGVYALAVFFFASSLPGEKRRLAQIAEYGTSSLSDSRGTYLLAGILLAAAGVRLSKGE